MKETKISGAAPEGKKDQVVPKEKWEFDDDVAEAFDDMLVRSIPQYHTMRHLCFSIAKKFHKHGTDIVDLGSSRGESVEPLISEYGAYNVFHLVEISPAMIKILNERYEGLQRVGVVKISSCDLRKSFPPTRACIVQSVLTIQFTPIEYRQKIIQNVYDHLLSGGVFIFVEKVLGSNAAIDDFLVEEYYELKQENGYTQDEIIRKKLSLEGVLVPVTAKWNEELLRMAGFTKIECFWRYLNFVGWMAVK